MEIKNELYKLTNIIARGGSAKVYKACKPSENKILAVKIVDLEGYPKNLVDGYLQEATLLTKLSACENVIKMLNWWVDLLNFKN